MREKESIGYRNSPMKNCATGNPSHARLSRRIISQTDSKMLGAGVDVHHMLTLWHDYSHTLTAAEPLLVKTRKACFLHDPANRRLWLRTNRWMVEMVFGMRSLRDEEHNEHQVISISTLNLKIKIVRLLVRHALNWPPKPERFT